MGKWISVAEKSGFLRWFLDQYQLKNREARLFLDYILKRHHILENLVFTDKLIINQRTVAISTIQSDEPGLVYYYSGGKTDNISKILNDLINNPTSKLHLLLHFNGKQLNYRYLKLVDTKTDSLKVSRQFEQYSKEADSLIQKVLLSQEKILILQLIDEALDNKDEKEFKRLIIKLQEIDKEINYMVKQKP